MSSIRCWRSGCGAGDRAARARAAETGGEGLAGGNFVLLASETTLPPEVLSRSPGARRLGREAVERLAAGADPLRDLDAPTDQLISR